jgi:DNA-binding NarL/FixJ family response regulator
VSGAVAMPVEVLLCEDAPDLRALVRSVFEGEPELLRIVGEADDGAAALRLAARDRPEVVLLDLDMPGPPARTVLESLGRSPGAPAIVTFTGHDPRAAAGCDAVAFIASHVPKTTDLFVVRRIVHEIGMRRRATLGA